LNEQISIFDYIEDDLLKPDERYVITKEELNQKKSNFTMKKLTYIYVLINNPREYWYRNETLARLNDHYIYSNGFIEYFDKESSATAFYNKRLKELDDLYIENQNIKEEDNCKKNDVVYLEYENNFIFQNNVYLSSEPDDKSFVPLWHSNCIGYWGLYPSYYDKLSTDDKVIFCKEHLNKNLKDILRNIEYKPPIYYIDLKKYDILFKELMALGYKDDEFYENHLTQDFIDSELAEEQEELEME